MAEVELKLDELSNDYKELGFINEKLEKRVQYLEMKAIWLVTSYLLFQGIIFFSISHASSIPCNYWWVPFYLSLFVAIIFGLTFTCTIDTWARMKYEYELSLLEQEILHYQMFLARHKQERMDQMGGMTSKPSSAGKQQEEILKPDMVKVYQRQAYIFLIGSALFGFTVVNLRACCAIYCNKAA